MFKAALKLAASVEIGISGIRYAAALLRELRKKRKEKPNERD